MYALNSFRGLDIGSLIGWHRGHPDVKCAHYREHHYARLSSGMRSTRTIFLDTNFWVALRRAELGEAAGTSKSILDRLRALVRNREALCVTQLYVLSELCKQHPSSLGVTAALVDELTEGVCVASPDDITDWEWSQFLGEQFGWRAPSDACNWSKIGLAIRSELPRQLVPPTGALATELVLKLSLDALWNASAVDVLSDLTKQAKPALDLDIDMSALSQVEEEKKRQIALGVTREEVRRDAFSDLVNRTATRRLQKLAEWNASRREPLNTEDLVVLWQRATDLAKALSDAGQLGSALGATQLMAELYTLYQTALQRRSLTTNDFADWQHAANALPNCDLFLTERHLAHLLRVELRADQRFASCVAGTQDDALELLLSD